MRLSTLIIFLGFLITGCSKENTQSLAGLFPKINKIEGRYLVTREEHYPVYFVGGTANFEYINNRLSKRDGGFIGIPTSSGYVSFNTPGIYDTVQYTSPNTITVISNTNQAGLIIRPTKREFTFENDLITKKITFDNVSTVDNDTIYYFYNAENRLTKTAQYSKFNIIGRDFFYDTNSNLIKISTAKQSRVTGSVYFNAEELFGGYDDKANPLKGPTLWQDMLYRSLSKNNFTTYSYKSGSSTETKTWTLIYDSNGNVDFSR